MYGSWRGGGSVPISLLSSCCDICPLGGVVAAQRRIRNPAEVTKHTNAVMDDFENSNHGKRVEWACAGAAEG